MTKETEKRQEETGLVVDRHRCVGCGICASACPFGGISVQNGTAETNGACTLCGTCVELCPVEALSIRRAEQEAEAGYQDIWVFAELAGGERLAPVVRELMGKGRQLADARGCRLAAVLLGGAGSFRETELISLGADLVYLCRDARLAEPLEQPYAQVLSGMVERFRPEVFLFGATSFGRSLAPRLAARLGTGLTADCTELAMGEDGLLRQTRPAFGGNLMATILCPVRRPQMATVRPGVFAPAVPDAGRSGRVREFPLPELPSRVTIRERTELPPVESIAGASVLVVAGRGIGSRKNLALVQEFARRIGAAWGCSRPLVDAGWCEHAHQVGQTGCSVAPRLLISLGVSGAVQHLAGIRRAETVVAVNTDPQAPIFQVSQYGIQGDCVEILREWLRQLDSAVGSGVL